MQQRLTDERKRLIEMIKNTKKSNSRDRPQTRAESIQSRYTPNKGRVTFVNVRPTIKMVGNDKIYSQYADISSFRSDAELNSYLRKLDKVNLQIYIAKVMHENEHGGKVPFDPAKWLYDSKYLLSPPKEANIDRLQDE